MLLKHSLGYIVLSWGVNRNRVKEKVFGKQCGSYPDDAQGPSYSTLAPGSPVYLGSASNELFVDARVPGGTLFTISKCLNALISHVAQQSPASRLWPRRAEAERRAAFGYQMAHIDELFAFTPLIRDICSGLDLLDSGGYDSQKALEPIDTAQEN